MRQRGHVPPFPGTVRRALCRASAAASPLRCHAITIAQCTTKAWAATPTPPPPPSSTMKSVVDSPFNATKHRFDIMRENRAFAMFVGASVAVYFFRPPGLIGWAAAGAGFLFAQRQLVRGSLNRTTRDLTGETIIVTGASNGIGLHAAIGLVNMGAHVIGTCHSVTSVAAKSNAVKISQSYGDASVKAVESRLKFMPLDLSDFTSIDEFVRAATSELDAAGKKRGLFALVNNAASLVGKLRQSPQGDEWMTACNVVGPARLTEQLLPALKARSLDVARVVNVSSGAHVGIVAPNVAKQLECPPGSEAANFNLMQRYALTKLVNIYQADSLAERGIIAVSCNPSGVATKFYRDVAPSLEKMFPFLTLVAMRTPMEGAQTVINCVVRDDLAPGGYYADCQLRLHGKSAVASAAKERELAMRWVYEHTQWSNAGAR